MIFDHYSFINNQRNINEDIRIGDLQGKILKGIIMLKKLVSRNFIIKMAAL
jgi:hypothetical protein